MLDEYLALIGSDKSPIRGFPMNDEPKLTDRQQQILDSMRSALGSIPIASRSCGDCAKCCEGWLSGEVYGHDFYPGNPCFFLEKTCSIYKDRPVDPCRNFKCNWLSEDVFPMWMKPSLVNAIIIKKQNKNMSYYEIELAGDIDIIDAKTLNWLVKWAANTGSNIQYRVDGEIKRIGLPEFIKM
ncbi:MAG: hypothetical protein Q7J20_09715 [Candidatus Nitrotoga sp.]|nr:hypothetical protein [Candidatus Nitrotoga sp.]MDO9448148.1 hypothetical protein [Candidatus Nitrotoga sp.]